MLPRMDVLLKYLDLLLRPLLPRVRVHAAVIAPLCDLGQVASPLWASVSPGVK